MKIELEINKKDLEKAVVRELAEKIYEDKRRTFYFGISAVERAMIKKAEKLIETDKIFDKKITEELKKKINDKKLLKSIVKELVGNKIKDSFQDE